MIDDVTPRWVAGEQLVIVWPGGAALVDAGIGLAAAERIWSRLHRDSQLGTFLKALSEVSENGFLDLPSFAIVVRDAQRCHIAVRGAVTVEVWQDGHVETLTGEGITTWAEKVLPDPEAVRLGSAPEDTDGGPIADGVVAGAAVTIGEFPEASDVPELLDDEPAPTPAPTHDAVVVEPVLQVAEPDEAEVEPDEPERVAAAETQAPEPVEPNPDASTWLEEDLEDPAETHAPAGANPYDSLWDESVAMDVEAAAIRGEIDVVEPANSATPSGGRREPLPDAPTPQQLSGDTVADEGLVEVVMPGNGGGPQVLARFCDRGHANPPERADCFVCGSEVSGDARRTSRPALGWIRVEGGETIPLRGPVIAGRNPKSTALALDETPRLVALPHPHVSSTHMAILIEGWQLLVRDLRSSNGTYLRRHGKPAVRLPETAVPLVPGDLIDLGKGLFIHLDRTP